MMVVYTPTPLNSMREICDKLSVGEVTVKGWVESGAPIAVEGSGAKTRYSAELARLLIWREEYSKMREQAEN